MATSKTLNQFTPSTSAPLDTDYLVGYTAPVYNGERRWTVSQLKSTLGVATTITEIKDPYIPVAEQGFIQFLAKQAPSIYSGAAVTSTNRVIAWGLLSGLNGNNGGHLAPVAVTGNTTEPMQYVRVPFYSSWGTEGGSDGVDFLDENPTVRITDLYWTTRVGMALLSDGSVWVTGYNTGDIGVGAAPVTASNRPTCGFVKLTFPGMTAGATIKKIQCASDNSAKTGNNDTVFGALDTTDTLWVWGATLDGVFGSGVATENIGTPRKLANLNVVTDTIGTLGTENFETQIKDWSITGSESAGTALCIILKNGSLYTSGDNSNNQRGRATTTGTVMNVFNRAYKWTGLAQAAINNAVAVERTYWSGRMNHYYIDTGGLIWSCGNNSYGQLGDGTAINVYTSKGLFVNSPLPLGYNALSIHVTSYSSPTVYAICVSSTGVKTLFAWGYNGSVGMCGVDSTAANILTPTICRYRGTGGSKHNLINVEKVFISDQTGIGATGVVDSDGYLLTAGYKTYNDPPRYDNADKQFFIRLPLKNIKETTLGGNVARQQWMIMLQNNGSVWGMGDCAYKLFGSADKAKHPIRLF